MYWFQLVQPKIYYSHLMTLDLSPPNPCMLCTPAEPQCPPSPRERSATHFQFSSSPPPSTGVAAGVVVTSSRMSTRRSSSSTAAAAFAAATAGCSNPQDFKVQANLNKKKRFKSKYLIPPMRAMRRLVRKIEHIF